MKRRQLSKNEILAKTKQLQMLKRSSYRSPFTGMSVLCNYTLWHDEKWYQKKLGEYNSLVAAYDKRLDDEEITLEEISKRLWDKAEFTVEWVEFTDKDITVSKKDKFLYSLEQKIIGYNNTINQMSTIYFLIHFNVLMDMGYGKKRLERNKDLINHNLGNIHTENGTRIMELRQELIDKAGIFVEMPSFS